MKELKLLVLLLVIAISSCNKNQDSTIDQSKNVNQEAISQIQNTSGFDNQKTMYRTLNKYEKSQIWTEKFSNYISKPNLNKGQIEFIKSIMSIIKPELFEKGSLLVSSLNEREIKAKAIENFGVNEATFLFADIAMVNTNNESGSFVSEEGSGCKCAQNHDWCGTYTTCQPWICTPQSGCGFLCCADR